MLAGSEEQQQLQIHFNDENERIHLHVAATFSQKPAFQNAFYRKLTKGNNKNTTRIFVAPVHVVLMVFPSVKLLT